MAQNDQNNPAPQKRLACDRCHARKLRCLRDASMPECTRCIQRGYVCTYSPPLKSGRPKKSSTTVPKRIRETPGRDSLPELDSSSLSSSSSSSISGGAESIRMNASAPYPMHLNASCEVMSDQIYLSPLDTDPLYQVDATPTSVATTMLPTSCRDSVNFKWLDMSISRGDISQHSHHNHEQHQKHGRARATPSGDSSTGDVEWGDSSLEGVPISVPYELQTSGQPPWLQSNTPSSSTLPEIMHSLSRLQQEFVHFRSQSGSGNSQTSASQTSVPPFYATFSPVNTILRPGQELVDLISRVFDECSFTSHRGQLPLRLTVDRRTLLPLILTPLSLLLSAYSDLLRDVGIALNQCQNSPNQTRSYPCDSYYGPHVGSMSITSSPREGCVDDIHREGGSRQHNSSGSNVSVSRASNSDSSSSPLPSTPLIPDNLQFSLDAMSLTRPLQLALITTVIKHHLNCLGDALHGYQAHHMHGSDLGISESLFSTSITELRSSIKVLLSEAQSLL